MSTSFNSQQINELREQLHNIEHELNKKPFEHTEEFRTFVVWLCGYTGHDQPPSLEDWQKLQQEVKVMAAKFALESRNRKKHAPPEQLKLI